MCLAQGPQRSDAGEARTRGPSVSSQAVYHWATALPCPVTWNAHKIKRVVRSTLAAETLSLQEGLETAFYYRQMVEEIIGLESKTIPIQAYIDNKSVIEAILSTRMVDDKRLRVDAAAIQELLKFHDINKINLGSDSFIQNLILIQYFVLLKNITKILNFCRIVEWPLDMEL